MTDLYDGLLTDILNNSAAHNPEVEAFAYALREEKRRIMDYAKKTRTISVIDELPEAILDVLAVELRTPYYASDLTIEQKRDIIKNTLVWFYHSGTVSAVEEMVASIFGTGSVVEWFDFDDGEQIPGTFDIVTSARLTEQTLQQLLRIIDRVKNVRSHLRRILILREINQDVNIGSGLVAAPRVAIANHQAPRTATSSDSVKIGSALYVQTVHEHVLNDTPPHAVDPAGTQRISSAAVAYAQISIT